MTDTSVIPSTGIAVTYLGHGLLVQFPNADGRLVTYRSDLYPDQPVSINDSVRSLAADNNLKIIERDYAVPKLQLGEEGYSGNWLQNKGNSATIAERNLLIEQNGSRYDGEMMDLQGKNILRPEPLGYNDNGNPYYSDLRYSLSPRSPQ